MTQFFKTNKNSIIIRISIMFLIFIFLITATIMLLGPLELAFRNNILLIRDNLIRQTEQITGRRLEYGSISPSFLGFLDIRNIRLLREDSSTFLSVSRLRLSFSLWNIIRGRSQIFNSARVDRPEFFLDFEKDDDFIQKFSSGNINIDNGDQSLADILPQSFQIRVRNGGWETKNNGSSFNLNNISIDGNILEERISFNSRWIGRINAGAGLAANMTMRANGDFNLRHGEGSGQLSIPSFSADSFRLQPLAISFILQNNTLELRRIYDRSPLDISLTWNFREQSINGILRGDYFQLRDFITLTGSLRDYNSITQMRFSGEASLSRIKNDLEYSINLSGLYESGTTSLPGLPEAFPESIFFRISAYGDEHEMVFRDLYLDTSNGKIEYSGLFGFRPFAPSGILSVTNLRLWDPKGYDGLYADINISSSGNAINLFGENISSGGVNLLNLDFVIINEDDAYVFQGTGLTASSSFSMDGYLDYDPQSIQIRTSLDFFSVQDLMDLTSPFVKPQQLPSFSEFSKTITERFFIKTEVFFTTDFTNTIYNVPSFIIAYENNNNIIVQASFMGTNRRFDLDHCLINWDGNTAVVKAQANYTNPDDVSFSLEAMYQELVYNINGVILDRNFLSAHGSYGFEVFLRAGGLSGYSGYAQANYIPLPVRSDNQAYLSFLFSLRYDSPSFWSDDIEYFEINNLPSPSSDNTILRLTGSADQNAVNVNQILFDDGYGLLSGNLTVNWNRLHTEYTVLGIMNSEDNEKYLLSIIFTDNFLNLDFNTERMKLDRINSSLSSGIANADINVSWSAGNSFITEINLPSFSFQLSNQPLKGSARAFLNNTELNINNVNLSFGQEVEALIPYFMVNLSEGRLDTRAEITGSLTGQYLDFSIQGEADFPALRNWLDYKKIMDSFNGTLSFNTATFGSMQAEEPFKFVLVSAMDIAREGHSRSISLNGGPRNMLRLMFSPDENGGGSIYAALSSPSPVRGSFTGTLDKDNNIDIYTPDLYVDMNSFWRFIPPNDIIAFPGGIVTAAVQISGPLRDPEFFGNARATSLRIRVPQYLPEEIRPVPVNIAINGSEMSFEPVHAQVGNGFGTASGNFIFERWIPFTFNLDINVPHENTIPAAFEIENIAVRGRASGNLYLAMADMVFDVKGDITAHNTEITLKSIEPSQYSSSYELTNIGFRQTYTGPLSIIVDILIRSGRQVEFLWPSADLPILQAYADMGSTLHVTSDITARQFTINGNISLRSGEIFYLDRNFYLRQGMLFFNENETLFEPKISLRAEIREQSNEGPVTISMIIDNAPLQSFIPRFESNPPLSQVEIYSILGQNPLGNPSESGNDPLMLLGYTADAFTQFTVMRNIQREVRNLFGLDMFSVRTSLFQNMVYRATGLQDEIDLRNSPSSYFDNTTIFLGKYLAPDIFFESMLTWRYDPTRQEWGGMRLEPEIGLEMRNPLFDIRLNVLLLHPENWFISDITLSLLWRWSF